MPKDVNLILSIHVSNGGFDSLKVKHYFLNKKTNMVIIVEVLMSREVGKEWYGPVTEILLNVIVDELLIIVHVQCSFVVHYFLFCTVCFSNGSFYDETIVQYGAILLEATSHSCYSLISYSVMVGMYLQLV